MKLFFYDLETTGTMYWKNGIHQIAGLIQIGNEIKERFNYRVKPNPKAVIDDNALATSGTKREDLEKFPEMKIVHGQILTMLGKYVNKYDKTDKFHLIGFRNSAFDDPFFKAFFVQNGDDYFHSWFWGNSIDVSVLASNKLAMIRHTMPDFKLRTVAEELGIEVDADRFHDADYDIFITNAIYHMIKSDQYETL